MARKKKFTRSGFDQHGACMDRKCGGHAKLRTSGLTGRPFYGCTSFPVCMNTQEAPEYDVPQLPAYVPMVADL